MENMFDQLFNQDFIALLTESGIKIGLILLLAFFVRSSAGKAIELKIKGLKSVKNNDHQNKRMMTFLTLANNVLNIVVWSVAVVVILGELGIDTNAMVAGLATVGLTLGIASRSLLGDLFAGVSLLSEDLIAIGDTITVGEHSGTVENMSLRYTQIRKLSGELRNIPNSELTNFGNHNRDFSVAVVTLGLSYEQNHEDALLVMEEVASLWARDNDDIILEHPKVQAITEFGLNDLKARILVKLKPGKHWNAEREIRSLIKIKFEERNVEMPFPTNVMLMRNQAPPDIKIDTDEMDIMPKPGSEEELSDPNLSAMVMQREIKRMAGAMGKMKNLLDNTEDPKKKDDTGDTTDSTQN